MSKKKLLCVTLSVAAISALADDSSSRNGMGQFYNGCPKPQEVFIHVCNGSSTHNFRLKPNEKYEMEVLKGATYTYMCSAQGSQADQNCPHGTNYIPLKKKQ